MVLKRLYYCKYDNTAFHNKPVDMISVENNTTSNRYHA